MAVLEGREGIQYQKPSGQREESPFNLPPLLVCEDMGLMGNFLLHPSVSLIWVGMIS